LRHAAAARQTRRAARVSGRESRPRAAGESTGLHRPHEGVFRSLPQGSGGARLARVRRAAAQDAGTHRSAGAKASGPTESGDTGGDLGWPRRRRRILMAGINYGRVVAGGLVAGVVLNAFDAIGGMTIFAEEQKAMFERLHLPAMDQSFSAMLPFIVIDFL